MKVFAATPIRRLVSVHRPSRRQGAQRMLGLFLVATSIAGAAPERAGLPICVRALIEQPLSRLPNGAMGNVSGDFASRMRQILAKETPENRVPATFVAMDINQDTCFVDPVPMLLVRYRQSQDDKPFVIDYVVRRGKTARRYSTFYDLSARPGLGGAILISPESPTSNIISREMSDHARTALVYLGLIRK